MYAYYQDLSKINFIFTWHLHSIAALALSFGFCLVFVAANLFVHEYAHVLAFRRFGYRARMIFLPWRFSWLRASHGPTVFASLGFCYLEDREAKSLTPHQVRMTAIAGPLSEVVFFLATVSCLWRLGTDLHFHSLQFAILIFTPIYCMTTLLNWVPLKRFRNDGWLMWNPASAIREL